MPTTFGNSIGQFEFITLVGNPDPLKRQVELFARAGVDGVTIGRTGKRGVHFMLQSRVNTADRQAARTLYLAYRDMIGVDPVELRWWGIQSTAEAWKVAVLDVRQVAARRLLKATGGIDPTGLGFLICDWDLIAIRY